MLFCMLQQNVFDIVLMYRSQQIELYIHIFYLHVPISIKRVLHIDCLTAEVLENTAVHIDCLTVEVLAEKRYAYRLSYCGGLENTAVHIDCLTVEVLENTAVHIDCLTARVTAAFSFSKGEAG